MADQLQTDLNKTVGQLIEWLKTQGAAQENRGSVWGSLAAILVGLVALAVTVYLSYKLKKSSEEIAKLKHEHDLAVEKAFRAKIDTQLAVNETRKLEYLHKYVEARDAVDETTGKIQAITDKMEFLKGEIANAKDWKTIQSLSTDINSDSTDDSGNS